MPSVIVDYYAALLAHFSQGMGFYKLFWIFLVGSVLGVVVETLWCLLSRHYYENRTGLLYGPFSPVYGIGAVALAVGLYPLRGVRDGVIFLAGVIIGSLVEYVCSWVQEKGFGSVSWDYSNLPFNLHGRINLLYGLFWGLLAVVWVKEIYPRFATLLLLIPNSIGIPLTWVLAMLLAVDCIFSALAVARWKGRINGLAAMNGFESWLDRHYNDARMKKTYTNLVFISTKAAVQVPVPLTEKSEETLAE